MAVSYNMKKLKPRYKRLANDHMKLDEMCARSSKISYQITRQNGSLPPEGYLITYQVKSIVNINGDQSPVYGTRHQVSVELPPDYPTPTGKPKCYVRTNVWHPNIRWDGNQKGYICVDAKSVAGWLSLDMLVLRIGEIIQFKNYLAENVPPYPEDEKVAKWVRDFAEPRGIMNYKRNKPIDNSELLDPLSNNFVPRVSLDTKLPPLPSTSTTTTAKAPPPLARPSSPPAVPKQEEKKEVKPPKIKITQRTPPSLSRPSTSSRDSSGRTKIKIKKRE